MPGVEVLPDGTRRVTLWKRDGIDMDCYASADDRPADSHKNSIERANDMQSVQLQKKVEEHERRFGPLGAAQGAEPAVSGLVKAEEVAQSLQKSDPRMSSAEAFRQAMRTPAVRDSYAREHGPAAGLAKDEGTGLAKATALAQTIQQRDGCSAAEAMRRSMRDPTVAAEYARETGHTERVRTLAKAEQVKALDEAAVEDRAGELEREGKSWREAWAQAIAEAGHGGGARAAAA
jgi:hypothetical protein